MISGWFGVHPSVKGFLNLLFQILFISVAAFLLSWVLEGGILPSINDFVKELYIGGTYWYIAPYFVLYTLSPAINKFVYSASRQEVKTTIILFFVIQFFYGYILTGGFAGGTSAVSFIGLYLLIRYVKTYRPRISMIKRSIDIAFYFMSVFIASIISFLIIKYVGIDKRGIYYNSPLTISASFFFFMFFTKLKLSSEVVNRFALSAFSIYLLHMNFLIAPHFAAFMKELFSRYGNCFYFVAIVPYVIAIGMVSVLIDRIRLLLWNRLIVKVLPYINFLLVRTVFKKLK